MREIDDFSEEAVRNKLNKIIKYRCEHKFRDSSCVAIDVPNSRKQIFLHATRKGIYVAIIHGIDELNFKTVKLFSNKNL
jgi:hypothetical protein